MTHTLGLFVPDSNDCKVQRVSDMSTYIESDDFPVENGLLEVTPPGYSCPVILSAAKNFDIVLNVSNLGIAQNYSSTMTMTLPDGIYHYRYSIDPNISIYVEKDVMRTCKLSAKYREAIRQLFNDRVSLGKELFNKKVRDLYFIFQLIQASVYMLEDGSTDKNQSLALYNEAYTLLKDYNDCISC